MKPDTYRQWRRLLHDVLTGLGWVVFYQAQSPHPERYARERYRALSRARRIHKRMEAERDAFTDDYARAIYEMVFDRRKL